MRFKPFLICSSALTVATALVFSGCEELGLIPDKEKQEQQADGNEDDILSKLLECRQDSPLGRNQFLLVASLGESQAQKLVDNHGNLQSH